MSLRLCLAIDPGDHAAGLALFVDTGRGWRLHSSRAVEAPKGGALLDQVAAASVVLRMLQALDGDALADAADATPEPALILTERWTNPHLSRASLDSLAASQRVWVLGAGQAFAAWGCRTESHRVNAQWWQAIAGVGGRMGKLLGGTKAASCRRAADVAGHDVASDDEADAINLGDVWLAAGAVAGEKVRAAALKASRERKKAGGRGGWTPELLADLKARGII